jgi:hypothetical protein
VTSHPVEELFLGGPRSGRVVTVVTASIALVGSVVEGRFVWAASRPVSESDEVRGAEGG